jgi:uncharacterized protein YjbI with pentapeptide repeats/beta-lactamase regulating signal transducer with metallopeptidase domain
VLQAVVGVALYAVVASIVLGAVLTGCVFLATRALPLTASTRHLLWTIALIATGTMPILGIGASIVRAELCSTPTTTMSTPNGAHRLLVAGPPAHGGPVVLRLDDSARGMHDATAPSTPVNTAPSEPFAMGSLRNAIADDVPSLSRDVALALVAVWLLGAAIGLGGLLFSVLRVRGLKRRSSPLDSPLADELPWLTEVGPGREIYLRLSYETETPVAIGFRRPVILIPTELATAEGLSAIEQLILHEHAHLRRYDDWTNLIQRTIERIFWFNPIVWILGRRIALEREIASDDAVVDRTGAPHQYATSLWKLAREMRMPEHAVVAPGALLTRKQISIRIEQLLDKNRARLHGSPIAALGVALAGCAAVALVATAAPAVELPASPASTMADTMAAPPATMHAAQTRANPAPRTQLVIKRIYVTEAARVAKAEASTVPVAPAAPAPPATLATTPARTRAATAPRTHEASASGSDDAAVAAAWGTHLASQIVKGVAGDVGRSVGDAGRNVDRALKAIPQQVAQNDSDDDDTTNTHHHTRASNVHWSRAMVASCVGCNMRGADLRGDDLHDITINGDDLSGANLTGANLANASLIGVDLRDANLANANLQGATLNGDELQGAILDGANLAGIHLIGVEIRGVSLHGTTTLRDVVANCTGCDLHGMDLHGQDLHGLVISGADLRGANLSGARLNDVHLTGVDLSNANLTNADLTGATLDGCDMHATNISGARTEGLVLHGTDLSEVVWPGH